MELKYKYEGKWWIIVLSILMFGGGSIFFYSKGYNNDRGLIINDILELSVNGATIFYWSLFTLITLFLILILGTIYFKIKETNFLEIHQDYIIIPPVGFRRKRSEILFEEIISLKETAVSGNLILTIESENEKRGIVRSLLPKKRDYDEIKKIITEKINGI